MTKHNNCRQNCIKALKNKLSRSNFYQKIIMNFANFWKGFAKHNGIIYVQRVEKFFQLLENSF